MKASADNSKRRAVKRGEAREQLMAAAQKLIIARGVEGVSIRAINAAAGVSPSILHYHFGSLDELVLELIERHMGPLMEERRALLDERLASGKFTIRDVAEVLALPLAKLGVDGGEEGIGYVRLLARLYGDRSSLLEQAEQRWTNEVTSRLFQILQELCPGVPPGELALRLGLASDVLLRGLAELHTPPRVWQTQRGLAVSRPWEQVRQVVDFMSAGLAGRPAAQQA